MKRIRNIMLLYWFSSADTDVSYRWRSRQGRPRLNQLAAVLLGAFDAGMEETAMPEMHFTVRWPDGSTERCYSPSLVAEDFLASGTSYRLDDFVRRSRAALTEASERVRAKFGMGCGQAVAQLERIERRAGAFAEDAVVTVDGFER